MSEVKRKQFLPEDEPPPKKLITEGDLLIKKLYERQTNTSITLADQLAKPTKFEKAVDIEPFNLKGTSTLNDFTSAIDSFESREKLKCLGLADDEIRLLADASRGEHFLVAKHRNIDKSLLQQRVHGIKERIRHEAVEFPSSGPDFSRKHQEKLAAKPQSVETKLLKFALENEQGVAVIPSSDPMTIVKQLERDLFGCGSDSVQSTGAIRRKARKLARRAEAGEQSHCASSVKVFLPKIERLVNDSKWDVKSKSEEVKVVTGKAKVYGCAADKASQNYYTVKDGVIVKLDQDKVVIGEADTDSDCRRLSIEDIRKIPKFEQFHFGTPTKVLYLRNLSSRANEQDLRNLFRNHGNEELINYKVMKGKMNGQAFVTFPDTGSATVALDELNGRYVRNKPVIMQYGRGQTDK